jgi:hypothetical protein
MCISKRDIRPGIQGIVDHIDTIDEVRQLIQPILSLMIFGGEINPRCGELLTGEELSSLGMLIRNMLDEVFAAADGIYKIYEEEVRDENY